MSEKQKQYPRFRIGARTEHIILFISFTILAVTGLPQKYAETGMGENLIELMGGIETVRIVHRWAAFILIAGSGYHFLTATYRFFVKRERMRILPDWQDVKDLKNTVSYNLGFQDKHPEMRKFNFGEKVEYWAVVWGTGVMIVTGFMLMNPVATTAILPGQFIPAALSAHGWEALLAVLVIVIWHFYNVLIKHFNPSIWTGNLPRNQMEEEHALELERLESGGSPWPGLDLPILYRRRRIYIVVSLVVGALILAVAVWAFTFEETAITTIPQVTRDVFVPLETPAP